MKKIALWSLLVVSLMFFLLGCGGKTTSLEGKVVDGKGQPLAKMKVAAKMLQPIKGYEQYETTTGSDGAFKFKKLFPTTEYQLIFYSDRWTTEKKIKTDSGSEGQAKILPEPVMIRFMDATEGVVLDTKTDLMWAAKDSGSPMNWMNTKNYCVNYRGGGYTGWRMPTKDELARLYAGNAHKSVIQTNNWLWAAESRGSNAVFFQSRHGFWDWSHQSHDNLLGALPVRSVK
jgi:hypothetical protein